MNNLFSILKTGLRQAEYRLLGDLPAGVRHNQYVDLSAALLFGPFVTGLNFVPVVLRRLGASPDWLAFYSAQAFIGFMLTTFSVMVMPRQRGLMWFSALFWLLSRGSFLLMAFVTRSEILILLTLFFWIMESFPLPAYTRLMQAIFPARLRGRAMSLTRVGMSLTSLAMTPVAGWLLDKAGHQWLYPLVAVSAILSILLFTRLKFADADVPPSLSGSAGSVWAIVGQDRRFAVYLVGLVCFGVGHLLGIALYPLVQVDRLQLTYSEIGALGIVQSTFFLLSYMLLGSQIDQRGGLHTLRWVFLIGAIVPFSYMLATSGLMLAPAFAALGFVNAGLDLGVLNTVMQLSKPGRLGEYSALQTTVLGLRGLIAPFLGVWLLKAGVPFPVTFGLSVMLILLSVYILRQIKAEN